MIENLKDLEKLLRILRKQGVTEIKLGTVELKLGEMPTDGARSSQSQDLITTSDNPYANFPQGELSPEQLAFYSAGGMPEDDPYLKEQ